MAGSAPIIIDRITVGRGALWSLAGTGAGQAIALLTFLFTARYVSKESFGIMAVSLATVEFLKRVGIEPFALAVTTRSDAREADYDACFVLTIGSTALVVAGVLGASMAVQSVAGRGDLVVALRLVAALTLTVGLWRTHEAWLVRHMQFRTLAIRSVVAALAGGGVGVAMAVRGFDLWSLVGQQVVTGVTSLVLLWTTSPWRPRLATTADAVRANLAASKHLSLSAVGVFFSTEADIFVASAVLGIQAAGLYNGAKRIMLALHLFLTNSVQSVTLPAFANMADPDARRAASLRAIGVVASLTVPAALGIMTTSRDLLSVLLGQGWVGAAPILSALALSLATTAMLQFNVTLFMVNGRLPAVTRYAMLNSALNVAVLPAAALLGSTALALGVSAVQLAIFPLSTRTALRAAGLSPADYADRIGRPLLAATAMAAVVDVAQRGVSLGAAASLALSVPLGAAVYFALLALLSPAAVRELVGLARSILRRRRPALP